MEIDISKPAENFISEITGVTMALTFWRALRA